MSIRSLFEPKRTFPPEMMAVMGDAVEGACTLLEIDAHDGARRENVAHLIIMLAEADEEATALELRDRAVRLLSGPSPA